MCHSRHVKDTTDVFGSATKHFVHHQNYGGNKNVNIHFNLIKIDSSCKTVTKAFTKFAYVLEWFHVYREHPTSFLNLCDGPHSSVIKVVGVICKKQMPFIVNVGANIPPEVGIGIPKFLALCELPKRTEPYDLVFFDAAGPESAVHLAANRTRVAVDWSDSAFRDLFHMIATRQFSFKKLIVKVRFYNSTDTLVKLVALEQSFYFAGICHNDFASKFEVYLCFTPDRPDSRRSVCGALRGFALHWYALNGQRGSGKSCWISTEDGRKFLQRYGRVKDCFARGHDGRSVKTGMLYFSPWENKFLDLFPECATEAMCD